MDAGYGHDAKPPVDNGAADYLPDTALPSTRGDTVRLDAVPEGFARLIVYAYPLTGRPRPLAGVLPRTDAPKKSWLGCADLDG